MSKDRVDTRNEDFKKALLIGKPQRYGQKVYEPNEYGSWKVTGEDPNCDMGGSHHEPNLGTFTGTFKDVVNKVVDLPGFFQWGSGGKIEKVKTIKVSAVDNSLVDEISVVKAKVWVVFHKMSPKAFFVEEDARDYAVHMFKKTTVQCEVRKCPVLIYENNKVFLLNQDYGQDGIIGYQPMDPEKLRQAEIKKKALAKLTAEERKLLGISDTE